MRVTALGSASMALAAVTDTAQRLATVQAQLATQRKITKPSDDPVGAAQALALRSATARQNAYARSTSDASSRLSALDGALGGTVTMLQRAQDLVRQGLNTGSVSSDTAAALAGQLRAVNADLLRTANTLDSAGKPIFGGTANSTAAFDAAGNYLGNATVAGRVVAPGVTVAVSRDGSSVFGSASASVFAIVQDAATAVAAGDEAGIQKAYDALSGALSNVEKAQSMVGADETRLQQVTADAQTQATTTAGALSQLQDVDLADMAIKLSAANLTYDAALQATAKTSQVSLLDFLR